MLLASRDSSILSELCPFDKLREVPVPYGRKRRPPKIILQRPFPTLAFQLVNSTPLLVRQENIGCRRFGDGAMFVLCCVAG